MDYLIKPAARVSGQVEVVRSFTRKLNLGSYESADFFCSQKVICDAEQADEISAAVYGWCKAQVMRDIQTFRSEIAAQFGPQKRSA
jgi:hypothetical protein